ncbi:ribonuclease Z [Amycolatopsis sp. FDAARGOS 1241]|uniref:ribonuclease Z n=1 Tax=Amycolatopsis sp. FDAARGOS 1241 TaxID=2778070 RepID=UPI00194ED59F|nr:ribonuclease Z [Amycolatopsis sp. FDAARGOS 1241]QRP47696.1 ribonuclease Z [Amycolatopsis sp. FDAARGOS 1241]
MSRRELVVLGSASQTPTRHRNHNGYLLRFDTDGLLFDPGEGTQRQMAHAGVAANELTRICVTHFHGDHSLGLAGVLQRLSLDAVAHPVRCHYPATGQVYFDRLRHSTVYQERVEIVPAPVGEGWRDGPLTVFPLDHRIDCFGYRYTEPDGIRMLPDRLEAAGVRGPAIGRLKVEGSLDIDGRTVHVADVSRPKPGQVVAFVMDTRLCRGAVDCARYADLLVAESTFRAADAELATRYGHLTSTDAGRIAAEAGARKLVLTHFSQRYPYEEADAFGEEAAKVFDGEIVVARDFDVIPLPRRR